MLEKTIRYHSRYELPQNLTDREKQFCQIIRDADKIDIFRANYTTGMETIYNTTTEELKNASITPEVYEAFQEKHTVLRTLNKTIIDHLIAHLSLYYGLIYPESKKMAVEQGYLWKMANFHSDNPETEMILEEIRNEQEQEWQP
ncbi:metal-dependent phosphohydrolase [Lachnospiraceae bacterium KM106-2]|nr:metal-dependent phosphohydrolase [Lachnospiraceae bacterium KM106-2]